jgi:hypothetical protein
LVRPQSAKPKTPTARQTPSIDSLTDRSNPAWDRFTIDWSASESDGKIDTVVVELLDASGTLLDSPSDDISGFSAPSSNDVRS